MPTTKKSPTGDKCSSAATILPSTGSKSKITCYIKEKEILNF